MILYEWVPEFILPQRPALFFSYKGLLYLSYPVICCLLPQFWLRKNNIHVAAAKNNCLCVSTMSKQPTEK